MPGLTPQPYAVTQHWDLSQTKSQPAAVLAEYLQALAVEFMATGPCVVSHIRARAIFERSRYLRVSVTGAGQTATLEGFAPPICKEMNITLNILVYGLTADTLEKLTRQVAQETAQKWQLEIS
jgi:hypothetical protein